MGLRRRAVDELTGAQPGPPPFAWQDLDAVVALLAPHGFSVTAHEHRLPFTAPSPEAYTDDQLAHHPLWVEGRPVLEAAGRWDPLRAEILELFTAANEDPDAFRITSDYVVMVANR
jgi:hypothetical protein